MSKHSWLKRVGCGFLVVICALPCILYTIGRLPLVQRYYANRLDYVLGEVEPVSLAGDNLGSPFLSPDGKWLAFANNSIQDDGIKLSIMDTETYDIYSVSVPDGFRALWIDNHHFLLGPTLIRIPEMSGWQIEHRSIESGSVGPGILGKASHIFVIEGLLSHGYLLISTDPQLPYAMAAPLSQEELGVNLADNLYTIVPKKVWDQSLMLENERVYSPDGKYFVSGVTIGYSPGDEIIHPQGFRQPLAIFEANTVVVTC